MLLYLLIFLGGCSPIHCRVLITIAGLICIELSVNAGNCIAQILGHITNGTHDALPILMIGIGVDDMFVVCNSIDQVSFSLSPRERLKKALRHSGPSITITSFTNSLAFLAGSNSALEAVRSFCTHASIMILLLYISVLTILTAILYWDVKRIQKRKGECFGLFCCKEDSIIFCKGKFLTEQ